MDIKVEAADKIAKNVCKPLADVWLLHPLTPTYSQMYNKRAILAANR
jgi:hypothetical protein